MFNFRKSNFIYEEMWLIRLFYKDEYSKEDLISDIKNCDIEDEENLNLKSTVDNTLSKLELISETDFRELMIDKIEY